MAQHGAAGVYQIYSFGKAANHFEGPRQGPDVAPTGPCTVVGWLLTGDGQETFCNGTVYSAKL